MRALGEGPGLVTSPAGPAVCVGLIDGYCRIERHQRRGIILLLGGLLCQLRVSMQLRGRVGREEGGRELLLRGLGLGLGLGSGLG